MTKEISYQLSPYLGHIRDTLLVFGKRETKTWKVRFVIMNYDESYYLW